MEYQVIVLPTAEADLESLATEARVGVIRRVEWLRVNSLSVIHHRLQNMPDDLAGLCRLWSGDYRILYWHYPTKKLLKVYRIQHRSEVYRSL